MDKGILVRPASLIKEVILAEGHVSNWNQCLSIFLLYIQLSLVFILIVVILLDQKLIRRI